MRLTLTGLAACFLLLGPVLGPGAQAASPFDGVYHGAYTSAGSGNRRCPGKDFTLRVTDGKFTYRGAGEDEPATVSINPDGSFSARSGQRYVAGKVQGGQMTATTNGGQCNYQWSLQKAG